MQKRGVGFAALLAVIGVSIVFGMILGGRLNAPQVVLAAPPKAGPLQLTPASTGRIAPTSFADIVEDALPAVVSVTSSKEGEREGSGRSNPLDDPFFRRFFGEPEEPERRRPTPQPRIGVGSGFIISPDGYVLTNFHVVEDYERIVVTLHDGEEFDASVVGTDPSIDLALLKIEPDYDLPTLPLGDSSALRVGEWVIAIGNPLDFQQTVTVGVVSGKERRLPVGSTDIGLVSFIQTDAAINFGNSGGPLLDGQGNVVGINTAIRRRDYAEGIGFALPIDTVRDVVQQLRETGSVRRGFIGISMNSEGIDETTREYYNLPDANGVLITVVTENGPADKAGLKPNDIIREVDGEKVQDNLDLIAKISSRRPGERVRLVVFREGKTMNFKVTLGDRADGLEARTGRPGRNEPEEREDEEPEESTALGITVENVSERVLDQMGFGAEQRGVLVLEVEFGTLAARRGISPQMLIVAVNDKPTPNVRAWNRVLGKLGPGAPVKVHALAPSATGGQPLYYFLRVPE